MSKNEHKGLQEYLQSEREQGQVDSEGSFRVDWKKAQRKVRDFAFEQPHQWICRYLQALTRLGNQTLNVQYGRRKLHLQALPTKTLPPPEELLSGQSERALRPFLDALWGADKRGLDVLLSWTDVDFNTWRLDLRQGDVSVTPLKVPLGSVHLRVQARSFLDTLARLFWRGQFAAEYRELTKACRTLPFPVFIDSRLFAPLEANSRTYPLWSARFRPSQDGFAVADPINVESSKDGPKIRLLGPQKLPIFWS